MTNEKFDELSLKVDQNKYDLGILATLVDPEMKVIRENTGVAFAENINKAEHYVKILTEHMSAAESNIEEQRARTNTVIDGINQKLAELEAQRQAMIDEIKTELTRI